MFISIVLYGHKINAINNILYFKNYSNKDIKLYNRSLFLSLNLAKMKQHQKNSSI